MTLDELMLKYPEPFTQPPPCGACIGDGWVPLIERILVAAPPGLKVEQIKEKFGGLRFYYGLTEEVSDEEASAFLLVVGDAEGKSFKTCEQCGAPGRTVGHGWAYTACESHMEERDRRVVQDAGQPAPADQPSEG